MGVLTYLPHHPAGPPTEHRQWRQRLLHVYQCNITWIHTVLCLTDYTAAAFPSRDASYRCLALQSSKVKVPGSWCPPRPPPARPPARPGSAAAAPSCGSRSGRSPMRRSGRCASCLTAKTTCISRLFEAFARFGASTQTNGAYRPGRLLCNRSVSKNLPYALQFLSLRENKRVN